MPNAALARRVMTHIETHRDQWDQAHFASRAACGTAYCFAGWTVKLEFPEAEPVFGRAHSVTNNVRTRPSGEIEQIDELAGHLLGLTPREYWTLFDEANSLDELRDLVQQLEAPDYNGCLTPPSRTWDDGHDPDDEDDD